MCNYLGIQDATRKRTGPSTKPGPCAATLVHTYVGVQGTVLPEMVGSKKPLNLHRLEEIRGFLNYLCRTYRWIIPYLKGLHLTMIDC